MTACPPNVVANSSTGRRKVPTSYGAHLLYASSSKRLGGNGREFWAGKTWIIFPLTMKLKVQKRCSLWEIKNPDGHASLPVQQIPPVQRANKAGPVCVG